MNVILLNYARSGGTLISRVLASLSDVVLVSEVNPNLNASGSIAEQAKEWHDIDLDGETFQNMALELAKHCSSNHKDFIVRDFSFIDFTPHQLNGFNPSNGFSTLQELELLQAKKIAFVRDAFDVWISRGCPPEFSKYYLDYVKALKEEGVPIFKYEDFCASPKETLQAICDTTGLTYDANAIERFSNFHDVTGDIKMKNASRASTSISVKQLLRKRIPRAMEQKANRDEYLIAANQLLQYPTQYNAVAIEDRRFSFKDQLKWMLKPVFKNEIKY